MRLTVITAIHTYIFPHLNGQSKYCDMLMRFRGEVRLTVMKILQCDNIKNLNDPQNRLYKDIITILLFSLF